MSRRGWRDHPVVKGEPFWTVEIEVFVESFNGESNFNIIDHGVDHMHSISEILRAKPSGVSVLEGASFLESIPNMELVLVFVWRIGSVLLWRWHAHC